MVRAMVRARIERVNHKAFKTLKIQAAAAWHEAPGTLAMVFAPPPVVTVPRRRRARKAAKVAGTPPETK